MFYPVIFFKFQNTKKIKKLKLKNRKIQVWQPNFCS